MQRFRCLRPDCSFMDILDRLVGKVVECPKCFGQFIATRERLKRKTVICPGCSEGKKGLDLDVLMSRIKNVL